MRRGDAPSMSVATPYTGVPSARTTPTSTTGTRPSGANTSPRTFSVSPWAIESLGVSARDVIA